MQIQNIHQLLESCISFAKEEIESFFETKDCDNERDNIAVSLLRSIIELSLGAKISAEKGLRASNELNYRSFLENYLSLKYILNDPVKSENRAIAYKISYHILQLDTANSLIKMSNETGANKAHLEQAKKHHRQIINHTKYRTVKNEFERMKKASKYKQYPKWYSLFGGPESVNQLIKTIEGDPRFMKNLYAALSQSAHGYVALRNWNASSLAPLQASFNPSDDNYNLRAIAACLVTSVIRFTESIFPEYSSKLKMFSESYINVKKDLGML